MVDIKQEGDNVKGSGNGGGSGSGSGKGKGKGNGNGNQGKGKGKVEKEELKCQVCQEVYSSYGRMQHPENTMTTP